MIHKTAIIDSNAKISANVKVGAYSIIGANVEIDEYSEILPHVCIVGNTKIGKNNKIYPFSSIGNDPQDLKFNGEETRLEIGDNNKIREYVTINPGTKGGGGLTKIGNNCLFMVSSHIAHDCMVGDNVILANNVPLGGHAMIGGMCGVVRDIIPYGIAHGNRSVLQGLNLIGLRRKNIPNKEIMKLSDAYKEIFKNENLTENLNNLSENFKNNELVLEVVNFLEKDKKRPICTPFSK